MRLIQFVPCLVLFAASLGAQTITTIAGGGPGSGGSALNASVDAPTAVAVDAAGNYYYASQNAVFKVDTAGLVTKIAGTGLPGFSGDGGPGVQATLRFPTGVAVDSKGNVFVADRGNQRIRKIDTNGIITTVAGVGSAGQAGDQGQAVVAQLNSPYGVAVDKNDDLYIADYLNNRIRKVTFADGMLNNVAGTGYASFKGDGGNAVDANLNGPYAIAFDSGGVLYFVDRGNNRVRKITTDGKIATVAGLNSAGFAGDGGKIEEAKFDFLSGIAVDSQGNIFLSDSGNNRIRKITSGNAVSTVVGDGTEAYKGDGGSATAAQLAQPLGIAVDKSGNLYIADRGNNRIRKVTGSNIATVAGNGLTNYGGDGINGLGAQLNAPFAVAIDADGNVYTADSGNNRIRRVSRDGVVSTFAGNGTNGFGGDGGAATAAQLSFPTGVAVDAGGNVFIADQGNNRIRRVGRDGIISTVAGSGAGGFSGDGGAATSAALNFPYGVAVDGTGNLYIADLYNNRVRMVGTNGVITTVAGLSGSGYEGDGGPASAARLRFPTGVAVGPDGTLYIADYGNHAVRAVDSKGMIRTFAGTGDPGFAGDGDVAVNAQLRYPAGVTVDSKGNVYIADRSNQRIRQVATDGTISTVAGNGTPAFQGDGGDPVAASLNGPWSVAVDAQGNLYIGDQFNNRVRKIVPAK